jgi:hypothetical protein
MNENQASTIVLAWFSFAVPAWQRHGNVYITANRCSGRLSVGLGGERSMPGIDA